MPPLFQDPLRLRDVAFRLIRDIYRLPPTTEEDLNSVVRRVQTINAGLNPEREFFALVLWLGNCAGIYAVEDLPPPVKDFEKRFRPSDFVAICRYREKFLPVLIEVKASEDDELVWSEAYLTSLRHFANLLHLPLLVAWKRKNAWALVDSEHFAKRQAAYHLSYETALRENLMCAMFGDAMVVLKEDFQFFVEATVKEPIPEGRLIPEGKYTFTISDAGFHVGGTKVAELADEQFWLFMASPDENYVDRVGSDRVRIVHYPAPETVFPLIRVLLAQLVWAAPAGEEINWNEEVLKGPFPSSGARFREALHEGLKLGTVRYVLEQVPNTAPPFLDDAK